MALNPRGYVVLAKMIPFVNLVWIGAALATAGGSSRRYGKPDLHGVDPLR